MGSDGFSQNFPFQPCRAWKRMLSRDFNLKSSVSRLVFHGDFLLFRVRWFRGQQIIHGLGAHLYSGFTLCFV